jgi:5'(3')-deoxyribonucleotidase
MSKVNKDIVVYIDMDGVMVDFESGVKKLGPEDLEKYKDRYDNVPGIFATMDPMPGAVAAYKELMSRYTVYFLSKPCWKNPSCYTDKRNWIAKHVGEFHAQFLILSPFKWLSLGDYLIDDRPVPGFKGLQLLFGSKEYPDWNSVLEFFDGPERGFRRGS